MGVPVIAQPSYEMNGTTMMPAYSTSGSSTASANHTHTTHATHTINNRQQQRQSSVIS